MEELPSDLMREAHDDDGDGMVDVCAYACMDGSQRGEVTFTGCVKEEEDGLEMTCFCGFRDQCNRVECKNESLLDRFGPRTEIPPGGLKTLKREPVVSDGYRRKLHNGIVLIVQLKFAVVSFLVY